MLALGDEQEYQISLALRAKYAYDNMLARQAGYEDQVDRAGDTDMGAIS